MKETTRKDGEKEKIEVDTALKELSADQQIEYQFKFVEATKLRLLGQNSDALELFQQCADLRPHAADPYYQMSLIASQINESDEAVKNAQKAVQYAPGNKWYRLHLANLHLQSNTLDSALTQYQFLVQNKTIEDMDILFRLAQLYQKNEKYREALVYYNKIETRMGFNEQIAILKKMIYTKLGEKEKAVGQVKELIEHFPDEARYYGMLAELYATFKEYDKAGKMYDKLFAIDSTNNLGQLSMVKYYNQQEKYGKALDILNKQVIPNSNVDFRDKMLMVMNFLSDNKRLNRYQYEVHAALDSMNKYHPGKAEIHAMYADYYLKQNEYKKSIDHLKTLAQGQNGKYIYWDQLLSVYSLTSQFSNMFRYGLKAIDAYPRKPRLYLLTSIGALQINKADTARSLLEEGENHLGSDRQVKIQFYTQLAEANYNTNNYQEAWKYFEKVLGMDPDNTLVLNNYSYYLSVRGEQLDKARRYSKKVIEQEPENAIYLDTYAWILYKQGKYNKARKYIDKAIRNGGYDDADIVEHFGDILFKTGHVNQAVKQWKKSRSLGNRSDKIEYKISHQQMPPDADQE
ncbi:MAG: tetratricopeptide repeat protein [Bacteroidales bacterium]|nr:tetratricopeptide repeat protein [Bacteroidales bacterium]